MTQMLPEGTGSIDRLSSHLWGAFPEKSWWEGMENSGQRSPGCGCDSRACLPAQGSGKQTPALLRLSSQLAS